MNISYAQIIEPSIFTDLSLEDSISEISEVNKGITDEKLINLIIKYFFAYRHPDSTSLKVSLGEIEELFSVGHFFFMFSRKNGIDLIVEDLDLLNELEYFQSAGYPISMLGDISSTTVIFKSIVEGIIDPDRFDNKYLGLDLGTGTGILLLAQYIQAKRNDFKDIKNIGIELSKISVSLSNALVNKLGVGEVISGDTTLLQTYEKLGIEQFLTHISNENIPTNGVQMTGENDPFHQNNQALFSVLNGYITENTEFFPSQIDMGIELGLEEKKHFTGTPDNKFSIDILLLFEQQIIKEYSEGLPEGWRIFDNIFPEGIKIGDRIIKLNEIGKDLEDRGLVKRLDNWRHRWSYM